MALGYFFLTEMSGNSEEQSDPNQQKSGEDRSMDLESQKWKIKIKTPNQEKEIEIEEDSDVVTVRNRNVMFFFAFLFFDHVSVKSGHSGIFSG